MQKYFYFFSPEKMNYFLILNSQFSIYCDYPHFLQLVQKLAGVVQGLGIGYFVFIDQALGQRLVGSGAGLLQLPDEEGRSVVQHQHLGEVDLFAASYQDVFTGNGADQKVGVDGGCCHKSFFFLCKVTQIPGYPKHYDRKNADLSTPRKNEVLSSF